MAALDCKGMGHELSSSLGLLLHKLLHFRDVITHIVGQLLQDCDLLRTGDCASSEVRGENM